VNPEPNDKEEGRRDPQDGQVETSRDGSDVATSSYGLDVSPKDHVLKLPSQYNSAEKWDL
jgi:hypothetical protein